MPGSRASSVISRLTGGANRSPRLTARPVCNAARQSVDAGPNRAYGHKVRSLLPASQPGCRVLAVAGAALALGAAFLAPAAGAATFNVDSTNDFSDVDPGDGFCDASSDDDRPCTLRAAVEEANALGGRVFHRVTVPAGDYVLSTGMALTIGADISITGASARSVAVRQPTDIDTGLASDRVFDVQSGRGLVPAPADDPGRLRRPRQRVRRWKHPQRRPADAGEGHRHARRRRFRGRRRQPGRHAHHRPEHLSAEQDADSRRVERRGGAIANIGSETRSASLTIDTSTISANTALQVGGVAQLRQLGQHGRDPQQHDRGEPIGRRRGRRSGNRRGLGHGPEHRSSAPTPLRRTRPTRTAPPPRARRSSRSATTSKAELTAGSRPRTTSRPPTRG